MDALREDPQRVINIHFMYKCYSATTPKLATFLARLEYDADKINWSRHLLFVIKLETELKGVTETRSKER